MCSLFLYDTQNHMGSYINLINQPTNQPTKGSQILRTKVAEKINGNLVNMRDENMPTKKEVSLKKMKLNT